MHKLTQKQKIQIVNFFTKQVNEWVNIAHTCYEEDGEYCRQYDTNCLVLLLARLTAAYNERGYRFTVDTIDEELGNFDTEFRDLVYEAFLRELPDNITRAVFDTTWDEYCEDSRKAIESGILA